MKTLKFITSLFLIFSLTTVVAQESKQVKRTTITKKFNYMKDGTKVPYKITIYKTTRSPIKLKEADEGKLNQDMANTPKQVSKLILVDNDQFPDYDRYIVVRYEEINDNSFELKPTDRGFKVIVADKNMEYVFGDGIYYVNEKDEDFFVVDEFDTM
ncbi:hypothetical protein U6A24_10790 [Aquimarina gracilis]|uniref:GLPGLI family protein n=1 Tax=Aquimarina gracilis TaxID=874422 RepID=A0ABU5ZVQ8_9FLAO|nr:hypothetical protein [Aquimarina gracilis]MEB3345950.1 hypothetical protein [Aquimarina gracilis]